ncbi:hypothetical protein SAMN05192575_10945 [Nocardioides alpinus]|uniref:Uncharacterized protein n=1 Tax=Nocardioides alpinus TaxID=748909 RepID=A0A1I1AHB6_9ACTN|nr:hypothetical protein [Nocardioides alpinus]PKH41009.1 hypothetical protein CXG46_11205 [Nocardioides alpinus]SFB37405.1 hypothetical protein SAMN05192575_10945 [Nocardioides alpinus]
MTIRSTSTGTALTAVALLATLLVPSATAAAPERAVEQRAAAPRTELTFTVEDCEGCEIQLTSALGTYEQADAGEVDIWTSGTRRVRDGSVTFDIATRRTWGLSVAVKAPWEGHTGYRTTVAWRYNGHLQGDAVTLEEAVTRTRAAACWEGVRRRAVTVPLVVEQVEVDGVRGRVPGSIAFVPTTQSWLRPMRKAWDGVLGSQDVNICH